MPRKRKSKVAASGDASGDTVYVVDPPVPTGTKTRRGKMSAGESALQAAQSSVGNSYEALRALEQAALVPVQQRLATARTHLAYIQNGITKPIVSAIRKAVDAKQFATDEINTQIANTFSNAMAVAGNDVMDLVERRIADQYNIAPANTSSNNQSAVKPLVGPSGSGTVIEPIGGIEQIIGNLTGGKHLVAPDGTISIPEGVLPRDETDIDIDALGGVVLQPFSGEIQAVFPTPGQGLIGVGGTVTSGTCRCYYLDFTSGERLVRGLLSSGQLFDSYQVNNFRGEIIAVIVIPKGSCNPDLEALKLRPAGYYICGPSDPSVIPPEEGTPVEPVLPPNKPPVMPPDVPCLKICDWPPKDKEPEECEPIDKCTECIGVLYMHKRTCELRVFVEGCEPDGPELEEWVRIGSPVRADDLIARLKELKCVKDEDEDEDKDGDKDTGDDVLGNTQLCDLLTPALKLTNFIPLLEPLKWIGNLLGIVCSAVDAIPGVDVSDDCKVLRDTSRILNDFIGNITRPIIKSYLEASGCTDENTVNLLFAKTFIGFLEKYVSTDIGDLALPIDQQVAFACPTGIPTAQEATAAYLSDTVNYETWRCWIRANNQREDQYNRIRLAARTKLSVFELLRLWKRKELTEQQFKDGIRALGYIEDGIPKLLDTVAEFVPGPQDIVRFMVRDVADQNIVANFGLDDEFDQKFAGRLKDYVQWQNVPEDVMKYFWRAHWNIPSPGQLFEFYQRFRFQANLWPSGNPEADIRAALGQQDIPQKWRELFIKSSFRRATRVDTRRQLENGVITLEQAIEKWRTLGYDDDDAKNLAKLADQSARNRALRHSAVKRRATGEFTSADMYAVMKQDGIADRYIEQAGQRASHEAIAKRRKTCIAAIKKRFLTAEFGNLEAYELIISQGVDHDAAEQLVASWQCELESRGKEIGASMLCTWFTDGLISMQEFYVRLVRVGYDESDAARVVQECQLKIDRKLAAAEKRRLAEQIRKAKAEAAERRRTQREAEQGAAAAQRGLRKQQLTARQRERILVDVATKMSARTGDELTEAKRTVNNIYKFVLNQTFATPGQIVQLMKEVTDAASIDTYDKLEASTFDLIASRVFAVPLEPIDAE